MARSILRELARYAAAVLAAALVFALIRLPAVAAASGSAALVAVLAVLLTSLAAGRGPGLLVTALIALAAWPRSPAAAPLVRMALFVGGGATISVLAGSLHAARRRNAAILESITDAFFGLDDRWRLTYVNLGCREWAGRDAGDLLGQPLLEALPEFAGGEAEWRLGRALRDRRADHFEFEAAGPDGGRWYQVHAYPSAEGLSVCFRDVTAPKELERQLGRRVEELAEADRRKDEFLAMLAHELRNPIAAIGGAVAVARRTAALPEAAEWGVDVIGRQVHNLSRLIDDLLDVSRIRRGKVALRRELVDAAGALDGAVEAVRPVVERRGQILEVAVERGTLWLEADPTRLEQVVANLLANAARYTEDGGRIRLEARRAGEEVVIAVRDDGIGIRPEDLPGLFDPFVQGDRSPARAGGGLGIGLTVVKGLVELHGGRVEARSDGPGWGSEFTVRLPAAPRPATPPQGPAVAPTEATPRPASRVLVVDDDADTARGLARLLQLRGHAVRVAHDGAAALAAASEQRPEVVLLDIGLPGMDGYEVAARLRRDDSGRGMLLIAVSGYGRDEDLRRSRTAGFDHHLVKPVDPEALADLIGGRAPAEPAAGPSPP